MEVPVLILQTHVMLFPEGPGISYVKTISLGIFSFPFNWSLNEVIRGFVNVH